MVINENLIKYMFNKTQLCKYFGTILIMAFITVFILYVSNVYVVENNVKLYKNILQSTYVNENTTYNDWLKLKCDSINCKYVVLEDKHVFKINIKNNILELQTGIDPKNFLSKNSLITDLTKNFNLRIKYSDIYNNDVTFIIANVGYIETMLDTINYLTISILLLFTVSYIRTQYVNYKNDIYEKGSYKLYTESKVQTNISEMINHELSAPIAILKSVSYEIRDIVYEQSFQEVSQEREELLDSFDFAISRIDAIVNLLSINKKIKKDSATNYVSIKDLISNIMNSINNLHVTKLSYLISDEDLLNDYILDKIQMGDFLNIIHVLITNSAEAGASIIEFSAAKQYGNKLNLFIKDNGTGIRNSDGKLIKSNAIFDWGYSSKNNKGEHVINDKFYIKLLSLIGISIIKTDTNRGIGLYVNKMLLEKYGGDIELYDTTKNGTTFKLTLPVKHYKLETKKK